MKIGRIWTFLAAVMVVCGLAGGQAQASMITYSLGTAFTGQVNPNSTLTSNGWLMATFDDGGTSGKVTLTLTSGLGVASEFISQVDFNVNSAVDPSNLAIKWTGGTANGIVKKIIAQDQNDQRAGGSHGYDIELQFKTASANRFDGVGETVILTLTGIGLTAGDFACLNAGTGDSAHIAAHIQGLAANLPDPEDSTWIKDSTPVPLPAAVWLLGPGLLGLTVIRRKRSLLKE
ncbi:VPLPA-CTERM protein sorting domain-containing protein [Syntrophus gentianae]|uniref:VPLPA-CTERM protein sorting domain-containing protein n=1 Tax=Syntrophus gentianae TaxID=43775 RepID=A0A1H7UW66_9BACT|nr:VPLPA-CTERM sorting domain-containing protein [Syntrophus gentianae]SEM01191.1 VPLPA-CTERM protein sorting domain-containing protein [Syntrophus gentianae]